MDVKKFGGLPGLMTGHQYPLQSAKKELEQLSEGRFTPHVPHPVKGSDAQPKRFSAVESDSKLLEDSTIPAPETIRKGRLPLFAVGGTAAALAPDEAQAAPRATCLEEPVEQLGEYAWKGVIAPHDGFSGLVKGDRYPVGGMKKELSLPSEGRPLPSYPHIPEEIASKEGTLPGRLTTVEDKEKLFDDSNIPAIETMRKGMLPFFAAGGTAAALAPDEAHASVPDEDCRARAVPAEEYPRSADEPGHGNREPGLGTLPVDIADPASMGAATTAGKALSVAAEPFIPCGMDRAGNRPGDRANGLPGYFGWGE